MSFITADRMDDSVSSAILKSLNNVHKASTTKSISYISTMVVFFVFSLVNLMAAYSIDKIEVNSMLTFLFSAVYGFVFLVAFIVGFAIVQPLCEFGFRIVAKRKVKNVMNAFFGDSHYIVSKNNVWERNFSNKRGYFYYEAHGSNENVYYIVIADLNQNEIIVQTHSYSNNEEIVQPEDIYANYRN